MVPLLGTPKVALPGLALSHATNCWKSLASMAGLAATANSKRASSETGTKSLAVSKLGVTSVIGSRYMVGPVVTKIVEPSAAAPLTDLIPIRPSPPVRFSTMTLWSTTAEMLRHQPAKRIAAAAGREGKDDPGQRTGLAERFLGFRGQRQRGASGNETSTVHCVVLSHQGSGLLQQTAARLKMTVRMSGRAGNGNRPQHLAFWWMARVLPAAPATVISR